MVIGRFGSDEGARAAELLANYPIQRPRWVGSVTTYTIESGSELEERVDSLLREEGITPRTLCVYAEWSPEELMAADWVLVQLTTDCDVIHLIDPKWAVLPDQCAECGSPAKLVGSPVSEVPPSGKCSFIATGGNGILVDPTWSLRLAKFESVAHHFMPCEGEEWAGWNLLACESTMPPMSPATTGFVIENSCPKCKRTGLCVNCVEPIMVRYNRTDVQGLDMRDICGTWELGGPSCWGYEKVERSVSSPYLIVSRRVAEVLVRNGASDLYLLPIELV